MRVQTKNIIRIVSIEMRYIYIIGNKMQFGPLSTRQAIDKRFKQLRTLSRQELLAQIYGKDSKKTTQVGVERDLSQAFSAILHNYDFDKANPLVKEIAQLFNINLDSFSLMQPSQRQKMLQDVLQAKIEESMRVVDRKTEEQTLGRSAFGQDQQQNHFEWLGLRTKYTQLRPIFQEILLEKVKLFDSQLTRISQTPDLPLNTISSQTGFGSKSTLRSKTLASTLRAKRVQSDIAEQFCDVKIRDKSEFLLQKWTQREEDEFSAKKAAFRSNLKINNVPVLFQFVKRYTATVKARDNIYRKWQQREKLGITPQEVRYLCATSLFLNNSLARSQKQRIKTNLQSVGNQLVSRLQTNIAQKIIQTYHQLMKRVSDMRAKYYEELTQLRKREQQSGAKVEEAEVKKGKRIEVLQKYREMFVRVINSERMRLRLSKRIFKWVKLFVKNLKKSIQKKDGLKHGHSEAVFKRLAEDKYSQTLLLRTKVKHPSSKIIKREDQYSHRLKYRIYLPSQRFHYERSFQDSINKLNRVRLNSTHKSAFRKQITGGPKRDERSITVDLSKKQVYLSSPGLIKYVIAIQAKWRSVYQRKRFLVVLEEAREKEKLEFQEKVISLKRLYPPQKKINFKAVEGRLRRVHMKLVNILQPYVRTPKRPTVIYTAFCANKLTPAELKSKHSRNGQIRLGEFARMVENNQYGLLGKSGIVVTSREINGTAMSRGANAIWWAVFHSNLQLTRRFLQGGGDPNSADSQENTCLHLAVRNGDMQIVFLLLDYGADLNRKNAKKGSCLLHASKRMLKLLGLQEGSVLGQKDNNALFYRRTHQEQIYPDHYY